MASLIDYSIRSDRYLCVFYKDHLQRRWICMPRVCLVLSSSSTKVGSFVCSF